MHIDRLLSLLRGRGLEIAEYCYREAASRRAKQELAQRFGIDPTKIGQYIRTGTALFGPSEDESGRQRAVEAARRGKLSIDVLVLINRKVSKLADERLREPFRLELHTFAASNSFPAVKQRADERLRELNAQTPQPERNTLRYLRFAESPDPNGMGYLIAKFPYEKMAAIQTAIAETAQRYRGPNTSRQQAFADALAHLTLNPTPSVRKTGREGVILLPADGFRHIGNQWLAATDGALIRAEDLASELLTDYGYAVLWDEMGEPVDCYRTQRLANTKQRFIMTVDQLLCADPTCSHLAFYGQAHHLLAWKHGGDTNLNNLTMTCPPHNAQNDDDRDRKRNGYYDRDPLTGKVGRIPPDDGPIELNNHVLARKSGRAWATSRKENEKWSKQLAAAVDRLRRKPPGRWKAIEAARPQTLDSDAHTPPEPPP